MSLFPSSAGPRLTDLPNEGHEMVSYILTICLIAAQICRQKFLLRQQPGPNDKSGEKAQTPCRTDRVIWEIRATGPAGIRTVKVYTPDKREGAVLPVKRASTASTIQESTFRFCRRQVSTTVSSRSTNRLPSADCVPNDNFRQITA